MTAMGQVLFGGTDVYSPWFERQADNAYFFFEVIDVGGSGSLTVKVYHKNKEDTGDGGTATATITPGSTIGIKDSSNEVTGLKELVRFEYEVTTSASDWVLFRTLSPIWYNRAPA